MITDKERLIMLEKRIKDLSLDKDSISNIIIEDIGIEAFYNDDYQHELKQTLLDGRLIINSLMTERRRLRESLGYDII